MKSLSIVSVFVAPLAISGCASTRSDLAKLDATAPCCATFSEMTFRQKLGREPASLEINSDSPVFSFNTGKAFFEGASLDAVTLGAKLEVRTFFYGITAIDAHYFYPVILFLDSSHKILATVYPERLQFELFGWDGKATWVGTLPIPPEARFAVFHTPRDKVDTKYSGPAVARGSTYMIGKTFISFPGGNITAVGNFGGTGRITARMVN